MDYSIVVFTAILIHLILNEEYFRNREEKNEVNSAYKRYIWAAMGYYFMDAIWGLVYEFHIPLPIYINSIFYYITMALTVVLLCRYVTTYLKLKKGFGKFINYFGVAFGVFEVVLLFVNHFIPVFFYIDSDGIYHASDVRYIALYIQFFLCVMLAVQTSRVTRKATGEMRKRYLTIFLFCVEMSVAIILQILYPLFPLYSVGLVLGISIISTFVNKSEKEKQYSVLSTVADIYYSMHVIDLLNDTVEEFNARDEVKEVVNHRDGAASMMIQIMNMVIDAGHKKAALDFTDLTTLSERMRGKKILSAEFIGNRTGWFLAMFIAIETDAYERPTKVIYTTRVIDEEKKQQEHLLHESQTDELTGLYNRRAYEENIYELSVIPENFIFVALDVNGLKNVNDTLGHAAGDELIIGASRCLQMAFGPYGKLFRTGGDEFIAILYVEDEKLDGLLKQFDDEVASWSGKQIDSLSVSYGFVTKKERPDFTAPQFESEADKRMYASKSAYYSKKGMDRRGQQDAHRVLCETYTKILKINLTDDSYQIVNMDEKEKNSNMGFSDKISDWLRNFALSGQVHAEDMDEFLEKTGIDYLKTYFENHSTYIIVYRRKCGEVYKRFMMEIIPSKDYSSDNQSFFLYVKNIEL